MFGCTTDIRIDNYYDTPTVGQSATHIASASQVKLRETTFHIFDEIESLWLANLISEVYDG